MPQAQDHGHGKQHLTNVGTHRVVARAEGDAFSIAWDYPGQTLLEVLVMRSGVRTAASPDEGEAQGQFVIYRGVTGSFRDTGLLPDRPYYYTVFARPPKGEWMRWEEYSLPCEPKSGWREFGRLVKKGFRSRMVPKVLVLACTVAAALIGAPQPAAAADTSQPAVGTESTVEEQALAVAAADPRVAAVLADAGITGASKAASWGGTPARPRGVTLFYEWPSHLEVAATWPLVKTAGEDRVPVAPYTASEHRLRIAELTGIRVDVLLARARVIQVAPVAATSRFDLREETWPPFSWCSWFTQRPWVLAPLFIALGIVVVVRAWLHSRAWNRQTPSMTRHDRQFLDRVAVLAFLLAGFIALIYEAVIAAMGPTADPGAYGAGDLVALPILLIPPVLFLASLVLDLSWGQHRVAWGLVAVLAIASSAFYLATAMTGTVTNLDLSNHILLAVLALLATPRAFSRGKMGWSRSFASR